MEMTRKAIKLGVLFTIIATLLLAAGVVMASGKAKGELPEYVGSQACLGCHSDKFTNWETSGHHNMLVEVNKPIDLPGDLNTASDEAKSELLKADWIVAGQRFLARDPATGELKYLNVQWDAAKSQYVMYKGGSSWTTGCAGCHSTGWDKQTQEFAEPGIGCEMCHGPGRDHILGKGDVSKITVTNDAVACGQCHNGESKMPDGTTWPVGYRPSMKSLDEVGFQLKTVDPNAAPPVGHMRQFAMFQSTAHARAAEDLNANDHASAGCYECHSSEYRLATEKGQTIDPKVQKLTDGVSCTTCHDPHNSSEPGQLREDPQTLCTSCHTAEIEKGASLKAGATAHHPNVEFLTGYGAVEIAQTKGPHSDLKCIDCHMTENNHEFKVIRPEAVAGTRKDTCTTCHTGSSSESRAAYLEMWQNSTTDKLTSLKNDFAKIDAALKANPNALSKELKAQYDAAKTNMSLVDGDGSKGAHNFEYATKILSSALKTVDSVKAVLH
jgi:predicted CXXCH cytochrome family protein